MRKYIHLILSALVTACAFMACSDMNDMHDIYLRDGEKIYIGRVDSIKGFSGNERILIQYWVTDPRVKNLHILWNQKRDSVVVPVAAHDPLDVLEVMIGDGKITEGDHTFFFYSYDDRGHRSVVFEALLNIYGERYQSTLINRLVQSTSKTGDNQLTVIWGGGSNNDEIGLSFLFTDPDGAEQELFIEQGELKRPVVINNIDITQPIYYQSLFLPKPEAIDTFAVDMERIFVKERINVALRKAATVSDILNESFTPANAVDGLIDNNSRWVSDASNNEHWVEVDLGQECMIDGFKTYIGSGGGFSYPIDTFEFQVWVDGEWITIVSEAGNTNPQYGKDFESVSTGKVRYYVPPYANNQVRLYELEVYSTITY